MHPRPRMLALSGTEASLSYGWLSEGNAEKSGDVAVVGHRQADATNSTTTCLDDEV